MRAIPSFSVVVFLSLIGCSPVKALVDGGLGDLDSNALDDLGVTGSVGGDDTGGSDTGALVLPDADGDTIADIDEDMPTDDPSDDPSDDEPQP